MGKSYKQVYERLLTMSVADALIIIGNDSEKDGPHEISGYRYNPKSSRHKLYVEKGVTCADCGVKANIAIFERHKTDNEKPITKWHWNFYIKGKNGSERMMTRDHILPKSMGGSDSVKNCQPMCENCNRTKGNGTTIESINVPFNTANGFTRDDIGLFVKKSFKMAKSDAVKEEDIIALISNNIYNHIRQGHNEIPTNKKWKKMKDRLSKARETNRRMSEELEEFKVPV